ncbi:DUF1672 family protein [Rossellomorea vietnamensis]|uniref:DUF1672 family protein n=1 Tax=Rossellomorea vietnamensis TaxID=218284 RepID=A0A0P6W0Q5_9BACI|nr:DUF1672 family protein [Rossellomorea vietnamensis]KPL59214.1 hypothetical protein AM506_11830 [Rossellomorea vietnamensis]
MRVKTIFMLACILLLGGCMEKEESPQISPNTQYERVQDYKGEGYFLKQGSENDEIAEANREKIEKEVKEFFRKEYKTKVKVHNLVGNEEGATVFVESIGQLHFYTYAVIPFNGKKVSTGQVFSQEGQVESGITDGLYKIIFAEEFDHLDAYLDKIATEEEVTGRTVESLGNVGGEGYMTPYYFIGSSPINDEAILPVYELYMRNQNPTSEELREAFNEEEFTPDNLRISIMLFMKEEEAVPSEEIFNRITGDLETMAGIPKGTYSVYINDNLVHKESSDGVKDNSLERAYPDGIVRD